MATTRNVPEQGEAEFLAAYDPAEYPAVAVTVDVAVFTIRNGQFSVLLVQRGQPPYERAWALPGGFLGPDEDADDAARRELAEETGVAVAPWHIEQVKTYTAPARDPRMRVVTVAYMAFLSDVDVPSPGSDAAAARFWPVADLLGGDDRPVLAFDHDQILADCAERARAKLEYTTLATEFLASPFTITDLRRVYEAVWGIERLHPSNFARKVLAVDGFVVPASTKDTSSGGRLYRAGPARWLTPPFVRPTNET